MKRLVGVSLLILLLPLIGCSSKVSYPAATVPRAIEQICKKEYDIEVTARVVGKTVGALILVDDLISGDKQMKKEAQERIFRTLSVVTRVALSSDLPLDFCTVIVRDQVRRTEFYIIRYLDDMKRVESYVIGVEETMQRTVIGLERPLRASEEDTFIMKDIQFGEFLAEQIAQRIRYAFLKTAKKDAEQPPVMTEGAYQEKDGQKRFVLTVFSFATDNSKQTAPIVLQTLAEVFGGCKFTAFDEIEARDFINRQRLVIDKKTFMDFLNKKITEAQLLKKCLTEYGSIQEALQFLGNQKPPATPDILNEDP